MPEIIDRTAITQARAELAQRQSRQKATEASLHRARGRLEELTRRGAHAAALDAQRKTIEALDKQLGAARELFRAGARKVRELQGVLVGVQDPAKLVQALATTHPVMLMPVSIQTRYGARVAGAPSKLMIRIYPDVLHAQSHDVALTAAEVSEGQAYWTARFRTPADPDAPWQAVARGLGPMRASYVVQATKPTNAAQLGTAPTPVFAPIALTTVPEARETVATALPDRFVAIGLRNGAQIFRKWGRPVDDHVPMSLVFDASTPADGESRGAFGGDRAWMVDYDAALAEGLAITIDKTDLASGTDLSQPIDQLIVLGVDWTRSPESAAALVGALLDNHHKSTGLELMAQGTPTNNTSSQRSGFQSNSATTTAALSPEATATRASAAASSLGSSGARLQSLLGLTGFDASVTTGADLQESATAGHMINALWSATMGYTLRHFWNPRDGSASIIDEEAIGQLRAFAVSHLRGGGPLSVLRVGSQPYGILPVVAGAYTPKPNSALERELSRVLTCFRGWWSAASVAAPPPTLRDPTAAAFHAVLSMQPWAAAKRYRRVGGSASVANNPIMHSLLHHQTLLVDLLGELLVGRPLEPMPFIGECAAELRHQPLDVVPWVQRGAAMGREADGQAALSPNYVGQLLKMFSKSLPNFRQRLTAGLSPQTLLQGLLYFAADEEFTHAGWRVFERHLQKIASLTPEVRLRARQLRYAEYVGVDVETTLGDEIEIGSAHTLMGLELAQSVGVSTIEDWLTSHFEKGIALWPEQLSQVATFRDSLAHLAGRTVGELSWALRSTLDLCSWRLDAWYTALATKRLDEQRKSAKTGLHIGAWGYVEALVPGDPTTARDSLGYVHAPSVRQATTAALLRSGALANQQATSNPFDIRLTSTRVARARWLLQGIANGQPLAALLGYRFERSLYAAGLSQYVLDFRNRFPLAGAGATPSDGPAEAIAARDVVDGVALRDAFATSTPVLPSVLSTIVNQVRPLIAELDDIIDAVSDLTVADTVHQIVGGDMATAAAVMSALDKQERPPEPRVTETPRSGRGYTQRVIVALRSADAGPWTTEDLAARVEPRLNAWLASQLGSPSRFRFGARALLPRAGGGWEDQGHRLEGHVGELAVSALTLVLESEAHQADGHSGLQDRISALLGQKAAAAFGGDARRMAIVLDADPPPGAPTDSIGLVDLESWAWILRRFLEKTRALRRMDVVRAEDGVETQAQLDDGTFAGVDLAELEGRRALADAEASEVLAALRAALVGLDTASASELDAMPAVDPAVAAKLTHLQTALARARALGWRAATGAQPVAAEANSPGAAVAQQDSLRKAVFRATALVAEINRRLADAPIALPPGVSKARRAQASVDRIAAILGKSFPLLPLFTLGDYASAVAQSLAAREALLGKTDLGHDDGVVAGWLPKLGCVRPSVGLLADVLTAGEAQGSPLRSADLALLQYPYAARDHWAALPLAKDQDLRGVVAVVAHAPGGLDGLTTTARIAGLFVDEWSESIPAADQKTAISFHYDAPAARAPQSILLAVPGDLSVPYWTLDALLSAVRETMALAKLRMVRPQTLGDLGAILPGIFVSQNSQRHLPTLDLGKIVATNLNQGRAERGLPPDATTRLVAGKAVLAD